MRKDNWHQKENWELNGAKNRSAKWVSLGVTTSPMHRLIPKACLKQVQISSFWNNLFNRLYHITSKYLSQSCHNASVNRYIANRKWGRTRRSQRIKGNKFSKILSVLCNNIISSNNIIPTYSITSPNWN